MPLFQARHYRKMAEHLRTRHYDDSREVIIKFLNDVFDGDNGQFKNELFAQACRGDVPVTARRAK